MKKKYRFLYHLIEILPFKGKRLQKFYHLVRFYYKGNSFVIVRKDGTILTNPLRIFPYVYLKASGKCSGNKVIIAEPIKNGFNIEFNFWNGGNNTVNIGANCMVVMIAHIQGSNGHCVMGNNNYICESTLYMYCSGKTNFIIGDNNLFSSQIVFWAGDGHSVVNPISRELTNIGGNIRIGNNNWIGMNVCFLKRAKIGNGCIVGYGSVVSKSFDEDGCVIAGNPANVIKKNIIWAEAPPWDYNGQLYREVN
ncbi:MAG: hypothetical protein IJD52_04810 [Alphaproteobacteria bacterium]|nr:hypothetical protein [Alphaproteobacteria bacterium]